MSADATSPLTFAVGDIHGCLDKLQRLLAACEAYAGARPARYVFLGDYIDRGPQSRGVVELLIQRQSALPGTIACLRGNHEQMAIDAHGSDRAVPLWLANNGLALRAAVLPRRRAALLRARRHRLGRAARRARA